VVQNIGTEMGFNCNHCRGLGLGGPYESAPLFIIRHSFVLSFQTKNSSVPLIILTARTAPVGLISRTLDCFPDFYAQHFFLLVLLVSLIFSFYVVW